MSRLAHAVFAAPGFEAEKRDLDRQIQIEACQRAHARAQAIPLLLIACSAPKLEGTHRAIDLYRGVMFDVLRKWRPAGDAPETYIISALHGLVHEHDPIPAYEQKMTPERQCELVERGIHMGMYRGPKFSEVFIAGGAAYRAVAESYVARLYKDARLVHGAPVRAVSGGIGQQRGQLGEWLRGLKGAA